MKLYCGIDLHLNNSFVVVMDETERVLYKKRLANDVSVILQALLPYKENIQGIVVESTYNWYRLVDRLQLADYSVYLANTAAIQPYSGLKYTDDNDVVLWLAKLPKLGLLQEQTGTLSRRDEKSILRLHARHLF